MVKMDSRHACMQENPFLLSVVRVADRCKRIIRRQHTASGFAVSLNDFTVPGKPYKTFGGLDFFCIWKDGILYMLFEIDVYLNNNENAL